MGVFKGAAIAAISAGLLWNYSILGGWCIGFICFVIFIFSSKSAAKLPVVLGGTVEPGFEKVAEAFRHNVESGQEGGGAFSVYYRGRKVVDMWGGYADREAKSPWQQNTLCCAFSVTKALGALCIAYLVDRGLMDYKDTVTKYWPEFGQNGKENITVEELLSHQAGLSVIDVKYKASLIRDDPEDLGRILAAQEPNWPLGSGFGYHIFSHGLLLDQLVRRVDPAHRDLGTFFQQEIALPFKLDFHIGLPSSEHYRCARTISGSFGWKYTLFVVIPQYIRFTYLITVAMLFRGNKLMTRSAGNPTDFTSVNDRNLRELPISSALGYGTAESLAKLFGILANGGLHETHRLLKQRTIDYLERPIISGQDKFLLINLTWGAGLAYLEIKDKKNPPERMIYGHGGAGGQMAMADPHFRLGWGYVTNYSNILHGFVVDHRYEALHNAMYECVQQLEKSE